MVSLLRRPFGFAVIYTLLAVAFSYVIANFAVNLMLDDRILLAIGYSTLVIFTLIYVWVVQAHLSNAFRLRASLYLALITLVIGLVSAAIIDHTLVMALIKNYFTWVKVVIQFVVSYVLITIGNWLASFAFKGKGHI